MQNFIFFLLFCLFAQVIHAQESTKSSVSQNSTGPVSLRPKVQSNRMVPSNRYLGKEKIIRKIMVDGKIPKTFPSFNERKMTKEDYELIVMEWLKCNQDLIKPEYHQATLQKLNLFKN